MGDLMGANTKIEWTDHTASPWHGCTKVAAGCENCYAATMSVRNPGTLGIWGDEGVRVKSKSFIRNLEKWNRDGERAGKVLSVFPSLCDPFEDRPELIPWRAEMFEAADRLPWIRLLLLTKRPENIRRMWPSDCLDADFETGRSRMVTRHRHNVWLGTSIATQADADKNIPELLKCRDLSPVLFLSAEPLIEAVKLRLGHTQSTNGFACCCNCPAGPFKSREQWLRHRKECPGIRRIDWAIVGGESGHGARPCRPEWIKAIRDQCAAAGVPCFIKQLGANVVTRNDMIEDVFNSIDNGWPDPDVEHHIHGFREDYQGADCRIRLRDKKGGDLEEWPEALRVREFPKVQV